MSETPEPEDSGESKQGLLRRMSARAWVELAISVAVGIALLIAVVGWMA